MKKKKGITINEMLQNDLETDEEKLLRHQQAQEEEKLRISELIKKKNKESDLSIAQSDEEEILRLNYQVKGSERGSNDLNNLSYNQDVMSSNPYQNDLAMLDQSYTGHNEGGFNGYSSMKKSEDNNLMNDSRPSSSPRNNNLMRTYDSLAMTQQFNYGFNYNTSGGGAEVLSQNSVLATSIVEKVVNEGSDKGDENMQYQSQKSFDLEVLQEKREEESDNIYADQEDLNQDQSHIEDHKQMQFPADDNQQIIDQISESAEVKHEEREEIVKNEEEIKVQQIIDEQILSQHENDAHDDNQVIHSQISDATEDNIKTEENQIQLEELKEQLQLDIENVDHEVHPDQQLVQEYPLKQELIFDEQEVAQISDDHQANIQNVEQSSELKEDSQKSNEFELPDNSLLLKQNQNEIEFFDNDEAQLQDEQILSSNHLLQTSLSNQYLDNEIVEKDQSQEEQHSDQENNHADDGELQQQLSRSHKSQEELKLEQQQENNDSLNSEPKILDEEHNSRDHQNDIEDINSEQRISEDREEIKSLQDELKEPHPNDNEKSLDQYLKSPSAQDQPVNQPLIDQEQESSDEQHSNQSPKSGQNHIEAGENEDQRLKDESSEEIQQIQIQDLQHNEELIKFENDEQQINSDEQQEPSQPQSPQSIQQSPRSHENKQSVKNEDDRLSMQSDGEEQKDIKESDSNKSSKKSIELNQDEEVSIESNPVEEVNQQEQVPESTENNDNQSQSSGENHKQSQADSEPGQDYLQEINVQPEQVLDQDHQNSQSQSPHSRKSQKISQHSEESNEAQSEEQQEFSEEVEAKIIEVSSQKSKNDQSNEDGFFQPAQDQKISAVDFDEEADLGNSFSQPNSFQQSSDTIKYMFDALDNNKFKYKSMSKRNLQIEIPETEYSGDENATVNQEEAIQPEGQEEKVVDEYEEPLEHHQVELPQEGEGEDVQSEHSEYVEQSSAEQEEVQKDIESNQDDQQIGSEKQPTPNQSEGEQEEESIDGEEPENQESPKNSELQISTPKEQSQSESPAEDLHINEAQIELLHDQSQNSNHEQEVISQTEGPQEQEQVQVQRNINNSFSGKSRSQNESIQSIEKQKSLQKSNQSVSQKQLSRKSSERIASAKEASQTSYKQASQQDKEEDIPQIEQPQFEQINSSKHSSNNSSKKNLENQYEQSVRSPLNQLESLHELKDYSIEDYVAEQKDIEMRHKQLNNDMYNLLSHDLITANNNDEYKSPKNNIESLSSISERNATDQQFFYRDGTANDSETHRENMMIIGDDMSSNGGNNFRQQQQQDNEDRYGNIGKWELEKKENEINEIESLDFSVKREEFPDQHYQSNAQRQPEDSVKVPEEPIKGEQMQIYNSPDKNVEEINLFNQKRDSKSSINIAPRPPSSENRQKQSVAKPIKKQQVQEKRGIQKIKDLFNSEEKYQLYERLHSKETLSSQRKKRAFDQDDSAKKSSQLTFKPNINTKSNILSTSQLDETKLTQRAIDPCIFLYHKGIQLRKEKEEVLAAQQKIKQDEQEKQCTFKPNIGQINLERAVPKSMYKRNLYWDEQRKKKIEEEKQKIKDSELDGCTFTPQIQAHSLQQLRSARQDDDYQYESMPIKSQRTSRSRNAKNLTQIQSLASERSVKVFIERQERAKQQKLEKDAVFKKNNGSNWKNEVTKPRPPKITDIIISNLQKKLQNKFVPQGDISQQQYSSRRKSKDLQLPRNMTQQHSREGSIIEGVDQDIMIFDDANNLSTFKKPKQSNAEFKEQVKFLRQALHSLDLDQ